MGGGMRVQIAKDGKMVIQDFSSVQAYKAAIKMEKDGIQFYKDLLKQIKDQDARQEIDFLIEQELGHLKTFQDLLDKEKEIADDPFEEDDIVNYMHAKVFDYSQEKTTTQKMDHRHSALEEAMNMERRSIVFYEGCLGQTKIPEARQVLANILEEEKKHLKKFAELLRIKCINSQKGCLL